MRNIMARTLLVLSIFGAACQAQPPSGAPHPAYNEPAPTGSRLVEPHLPQSIRHFALSPDRLRVAYTEEGQNPSELYVATLGEEARKVAEIRPDASSFQWTADGSALLYLDVIDREIPGQFDDWDVPSREILAHRLMRLPVEGGEAQELLNFKQAINFQASPKKNEVFFSVLGEPNGGFFASIHCLNLETLEQEEVLKAEATSSFRPSPTGDKLWAHVLVPRQAYTGTYKVVDLATKETSDLSPAIAGHVEWAADGQTLLAFHPDTSDGVLTVHRFSVTGGELEPLRLTLAGQIQPGKLQFALLSPDTRHLLAYAGQSNLVINLETGAVRILDSFGYFRCWLDDRTLMGTYQGGQYAVEVP